MKGLKGKRMLKRASALIMAGLILGTGMSMPISASAEEASTVLYYETFDNGLEGIKDTYTKSGDNYSLTDENGTMNYNFRTGLSTVPDVATAEYKGNKGLGALATEGKNACEQRLEYTLANPVSTGVFTVSYDVSRLDNSGSYGDSYMGLNYSVNGSNAERKYVLYIGNSKIYGPHNNLSNWGDPEANNGAYNVNTVYHVSQVYDLTNHKSYTYVDGNIIKETGVPTGYVVRSFRFLWSSLVGYFDNFKVTHSDKLYMNIETATMKDNKAEIMFTDGVDDTSLAKEGYKITDLETGEEYTASARLSADTKLELSAEGLTMKDGGLYMATFPSVTGKVGEKSGDKSVVLNNGNGNVISDFTLTDSEGATHKNASKIPADVKELTFTFPTAAAAAAAEFSFSGGSLTKTVEGKNVNVTLDKYLTGESDYTLDVTGLDKEYSIALSTKAGGVKVANCKYYVGETEIDSLDGVADGTKVKMVLNAVKTVAAEKKVLSAYSLYNGKTLKGFNYEEKTMAAADDTAKFEFEITLTSATDAAIKGFLKGELGTVNPFGKIYSID